MFKPYRSTPIKTVEELHDIYGTQNSSEIPYLQLLESTTDNLRSLVNEVDLSGGGFVMSVEGTWGSGKTSFVDLLCNAMGDLNVATVRYDSLYYGNASEATGIFIQNIFDEVQEKFGVKLSSGSNIAKNITPKFELSNGIPNFSFDFTAPRAPTEVIIKGQLEEKLRSLPGRMVVIIDDIDRVPAADVLHFLRLIRVLRELPNFIIIMPIDGAVLENLLRENGIESPRGYLQKFVDHSIDLSPKQGESKDLFFRLLRQKYPTDNLTDEFCARAWDLYLWEISLIVIQQYETRGGERFILNAQPTDPMWYLLKSADSQSGDNLVRKFFEQTNKAYGASSHYVLRLSNSGHTRRDIFQHYSALFVNMTFTDFMYARIFPNVASPQAFTVAQGSMITTMPWWDAEDIVSLGATREQDPTYRVSIPDDDSQKQAYYAQVNSHQHIIWDTVRGLAGAYLPEKAYPFLAPRTLNKVASQLAITPGSYQSSTNTEDYAELHREIRRVVQQTVTFNP
jgi:hypothetical protein